MILKYDVVKITFVDAVFSYEFTNASNTGYIMPAREYFARCQ